MKNDTDNFDTLDANLERYKQLYAQGRYKDILEDSQEYYGPFRQWHNTRLQLLASRCLGHLGMGRTADAIILRAWRKNQGDNTLASFYLNVCKRRRGPLVAWMESQRIFKNHEYSAEEKAHILCDQSDIVCEFRDFAFAEKLLKEARQLHVDKWIELQGAYLLLSQDCYEQALEQTLITYESDPGYRPAVQLLAHLYQLAGDIEQAIKILYPHLQVMQSYPLSMQLFNLAVEAQDFDLAQRCYDHIETILVEEPKSLIQELNRAKADLLCTQQRYEEALPLLEQKSLYQRTISQSILQGDGQQQRKVLNVPFIRQHHMTCAPASLTCVARYWGQHYSQAEIIDAICYDGTPAVNERRWVIQQGFICAEFELQFDTIKALIDNDVPVLLATVEPGSAHLQVLVGYDQSMGTYIMRDPYHPRLQEMLIHSSAEYYASSGPRCMVMIPADKLTLIDGIHFEAQTLYDKYHDLCEALDQHLRPQAYQAYREMLGLDAEHRLTVYARRDLAIYDKDEHDILKNTETLLSRFPYDVNLQLSKINSLSVLATAEQRLDYLEQLYQQDNCHFLVRSRLAEDLRVDHRQQARVLKLLQSLLRKYPTHTPTLYAYAGVLWDQGHYQGSFNLYRFITCLEDKDERYATSYFKAARYHKQVDAALDFLVDRYQRFSKRSCGPAMCIYNALDSLGRAQEGFNYLKHAMERRPHDGELILFTARQHLHYGEIEKCTQLVHQAKSLVNPLRFLELSAEVEEFKQDRPSAIKCWKAVLQYEPLNPQANSALIRLLIEANERTSAEQLINNQLKRFPGNFNLLRTKVNSLDNNDNEGHVDAYQALVQHHPDDNWAFIGLARRQLRFGELDKALLNAKEATIINANDPAAFSMLADIYTAKRMTGKAKQAYRRSIEISCDHTSAFEPLLQCALDYDSEKAELEFIHQQLMKQVSYGDGILQYQYLASRWLTTQEINNFLHQVVEKRPDLWQSWLALSRAYKNQDLLKKSFSTLESARKRFPLVAEIYYEKAEVLRLMNRLSDAEEQLAETLALAPDWVKAANKLSDILEIQGKFDEAIAHVQSMISRAPLEASPYAYLASLLWRTDKKEAAIKQLCKALDLDPLYEWAWSELRQWCKEIDQSSLYFNHINAARKKLPENERLLRVQVRLQEDSEKSCALLKAHLNKYPQCVDICIEYIQNLVELNDFETALSLCDESYWDNNIPVSILANRGWIYSCQNKLDKAITEMQSVVTQNPNYYDGWKFLANWYEKKGNAKKVVECIDHCRNLYPNDPSVLCFVAEKLQEHASDKAELSTQLYKRAFSLDPTNRYIGISYIDDLLSQEKPSQEQQSQAMSALNLLKLHVNDAFVYYRELQLAECANNIEQALNSWQKIITDKEVNDWLIKHSWEVITRLELEEKACTLIETQLNDGLHITPLVGEYLAYHLIREKGFKAFEKSLPAMLTDNALYDRMLEGYLRQLIKHERGIPDKLDTLLRPRLFKDTQNWGLLGYSLTNQGHSHDVMQWMHDYKDRKDVEGWMVYFYSLALRQNGKWDEGIETMAHAYQLEPDNYHEDIIVWHSLDLLFINSKIDVKAIRAINTDNIAGLSRYPLVVVKTLCILDGKGFEDKYDEISPCLRQCQKEFQSVAGNSAAQTIKNLFRKKLQQGLKQNSVTKKMFWRWRLSNHF